MSQENIKQGNVQHGGLISLISQTNNVLGAPLSMVYEEEPLLNKGNTWKTTINRSADTFSPHSLSALCPPETELIKLELFMNEHLILDVPGFLISSQKKRCGDYNLWILRANDFIQQIILLRLAFTEVHLRVTFSGVQPTTVTILNTLFMYDTLERRQIGTPSERQDLIQQCQTCVLANVQTIDGVVNWKNWLKGIFIKSSQPPTRIRICFGTSVNEWHTHTDLINPFISAVCRQIEPNVIYLPFLAEADPFNLTLESFRGAINCDKINYNIKLTMTFPTEQTEVVITTLCANILKTCSGMAGTIIPYEPTFTITNTQ